MHALFRRRPGTTENCQAHCLCFSTRSFSGMHAIIREPISASLDNFFPRRGGRLIQTYSIKDNKVRISKTKRKRREPPYDLVSRFRTKDSWEVNFSPALGQQIPIKCFYTHSSSSELLDRGGDRRFEVVSVFEGDSPSIHSEMRKIPRKTSPCQAREWRRKTFLSSRTIWTRADVDDNQIMSVMYG